MTGGSASVMRLRAETALASSPFHELRAVRVAEREDGLVLLGAVSSFYHKQLAQEAVRSVCRNHTVINTIDVVQEEDVQAVDAAVPAKRRKHAAARNG
jgi:hypothetical protein